MGGRGRPGSRQLAWEWGTQHLVVNEREQWGEEGIPESGRPPAVGQWLKGESVFSHFSALLSLFGWDI